MLVAKLGWRNVFRNKRRSILSSLAIGMGLASLIIADGFIDGMKHAMLKSAIRSFLGHGQIHAQGFQDAPEVEKTIHNLTDLTSKLDSDLQIQSWTPRTQSYAMVSSPANVNNIMLYGISPESEKSISQIHLSVISGTPIENQDHILLGEQLAESLEVTIGDRIVVTLTQAESGELSQQLFRVSGIFKLGVREMDKGLAFIHIKKSQKMLGLNSDQAHEVALTFKELPLLGAPLLETFWAAYSDEFNEAKGWDRLLPDLKAIFKMTDASTAIIGVIVFVVVALGIMNTLFMSLYERMFEFGILRAIGTRPFHLSLVIVWEAIGLAVISFVVGSLLALIVGGYLQMAGIDYGGIEYAKVTFQEKIYPVMTLKAFVIYPLWILFFCLLSSAYPAFVAARLNPSEAMRRVL